MKSPILLDLPMPITTPRLVIRPPEPGIGKEVNQAIIESFNEIHPWLPWADHKPVVEETEEVIRRNCAKWILREDLSLFIYDRATGKFVGGTGLHRIDWAVPAFEIGYWLRTSCVGRGYITEAANALTRYTFQQLKAKRVELRCNSKNERSLAVFKRLGFEYEGCLRSNGVWDRGAEELRDTVVYSRLNMDGLPDLHVSW